MRTFKSVVIVIGALMAVLYCGTLLYYFLDISGSLRGTKTIGLAPTLLGLGLVGLVFCFPLVLKIARIFARAPESGPGAPAGDDGFDADAAIARYMADRPAQARPATATPAFKGGGPARRSAFGRRTV